MASFDPLGSRLAVTVPHLDQTEIKVFDLAGALLASAVLSKNLHPTSNLLWIPSPQVKTSGQGRKKRRGDSTEVVVFGTNKGSVLIFSPAQDKLLDTLDGLHNFPITSVFVKGSVLTSCDDNGNVRHYDLVTSRPLKKGSVSHEDVTIVRAGPADSLLLGSTAVSIVTKDNSTKTLSQFASPVTQLTASQSKPDLVLASSSSERGISVSSVDQGRVSSILMCQANVQAFEFNEDESALAAVTEDGVEIFASPLSSTLINGASSGSAKKKIASAKSVIQLALRRPNKDSIKVLTVVFSQDALKLCWIESGVAVVDSFLWRGAEGPVVLTREQRVLKTNKHNPVDPAAVVGYNEANAIVTSGNSLKNLDSDDGEHEQQDEDEEDEETLADKLHVLGVATPKARPSVEKPATFTIMLTQALKSNDAALLETCLNIDSRDREDNIKYSIQRLDSGLAARLLERLAERIARDPGQASMLNVWLKWTMISHGGYLVTLPNLLKILSSLHSTLSDRVATLPRLLALQGRLELLKSQIELRKEILKDSNEGLENDEDDAVEYIESGAEEEEDDDEVPIIDGEEDLDDFEDYDEDASDDELANGTVDLEEDGDLEVEKMDIEQEDKDETVEVVTKSKKGKGRR